MTNEKIIDKVKKLLALSESPNEHEAKLALQRAQELLQKHNLTTKDIHKEKVIQRTFSLKRQNPVPFQNDLIVGTMRGFNCEVLYSREVNLKYKNLIKNTFTFIGAPTDLEIGEYVLDYLLITLKRLTKEYSKTLNKEDAASYGMSEWSYIDTARISYRTGLVESFLEKIQEFNRKQEDSSIKYSGGLTGRELIHIKQNAVSQYIKDRWDDITTSNKRTGGKLFEGEYNKGVKDGEKISIHRGINGGDNTTNLLT